jgi:hypothetical protein
MIDKICVDCRWCRTTYVQNGYGGYQPTGYKCDAYDVLIVQDPVTGNVTAKRHDCSWARSDGGECGKEGKLFEPKVVRRNWFMRMFGFK